MRDEVAVIIFAINGDEAAFSQLACALANGKEKHAHGCEDIVHARKGKAQLMAFNVDKACDAKNGIHLSNM